jgi:hypothetical protein
VDCALSKVRLARKAAQLSLWVFKTHVPAPYTTQRFLRNFNPNIFVHVKLIGTIWNGSVSDSDVNYFLELFSFYELQNNFPRL